MKLRSEMLMLALLAVACRDTQEVYDLHAVSFPLFTREELDQEFFDEACSAWRDEKVRTDQQAMSKPPEDVKFAPDIYAAIERAKAEDKPIYLITFVNENGDPDCDV